MIQGSEFETDMGLFISLFVASRFTGGRNGFENLLAAWQASMAEFFVALETTPDQGFLELTEVFNLEDQLAAAATTTESVAS